MATPPMIGGSDPSVLKSLEKQTPSVAKTAPPTVSATTGSTTSSGSQVARGIAPVVTGPETTYNQATQTTSGTSLTITSSTSNEPADVVTVYNTSKAISVSSVNQTVNTYKVTNVTGDAGVFQIIAGNNITITSTGSNGTGNVTINSSASNVGNIAVINLDGNVSNVLHGDGTWSADQTTYGNSNVAAYLPTYTGNVGANVVTANLFSGNGSNLTNLPITEDTTSVDKFVLISDGNLKYSGSVMITPDTGNIVTLGKINSGNIIANGNVTANYFIGNGSSLNSMSGANVTGTVGNANLSQYLAVSDVNNNFSYHVVLSAGSGDKSLHIDADDNLQYNPADGTLTSVRVDATYVLANLNFANGYLASNVVGLGNIATLNLDGNVSNLITGTGTYVAIPTIPTVGNIATLNLDGNVSNVLRGDGTWGTDANSTYGNSNVVSLLGTFGSNTISTTGNIAVGAVSASGKIGYASGSTVTQTTSRGNGVNIDALAGTIITTSAAMVATEIDTFSVTNSLVDPNNDIVLAQIVSPNQGTYNCIANPALIGGFNNGFYINIVNISGFTTTDETITIRFMVIKSPNA